MLPPEWSVSTRRCECRSARSSRVRYMPSQRRRVVASTISLDAFRTDPTGLATSRNVSKCSELAIKCSKLSGKCSELPGKCRSSASNRSRELRTSTRHRVTAGTVGERAPARSLAHQKPFPDRAVKSHGDVVQVLCRHLVEPAFTHPPEEGDDQHLRENPTLTDATHHRLR